MAFNSPRLQTEDLLLVCEEPQYRASQPSTPRAFTPSTMTTTTIVDASVTTSHVGCYVVPEDGAARGQVRQIMSVSGTTATIDTAWNSTASITSIRVWLPADVPLRATGSGTEATVVSSPHASITNEPDDYWNSKGYHVIALAGTNAGQAVDQSDFATATGTVTSDTFNASTAAGDLYSLRRMLKCESPPTVTVNQNYLERRITGFAAPDVAVPTTAAGTASIELSVKPVSAAAGSGTQATRPQEMSDMLTALFTEDRDTGSTVSSATATTLVVGSGSNFSRGGFVRVNTGEVAHIRDLVSNTLTVPTGHITHGNVEASSVAYASAWYQRKNNDFRTFTIEYYLGGLVRKMLHGCAPTLTMTISRDQVVRFAFNYSAGEAFQYTKTRPVLKGAEKPLDIIDRAVPRDAKASRCLFNATNVLISEFTMDFGFRPVLRPSLTGMNQADGYIPVLEPISGSFKILADEDDRTSFEDIKDLCYRRACVDFLYQNGTAPGEIFALAIPAMQLLDVPMAHQDGMGVIDARFTVVQPQAVPGASPAFNAACPEMSIGWL